jgi:N-acetylmuramic acid 6-phosphate etherase
VVEATGCTDERARQALAEASGSAKVAIVAILLGISSKRATQVLDKACGSVSAALAGE